MDSEELQKWRKAGKIAAQALQYGKTLIKPGASMREVCDKVDAKIIELGARPAWPTQIGCNDVAAHFTPDPDDDTVFKDELVCLDVGAHVDGYVGDNALTVDLSGKRGKFVDAAKHAMEAAAKLVKAGVSISEISHIIQETIVNHGLQPVRNLSGHTISRWVIHDKPSVPNVEAKNLGVLKEGQVIAIEPFVTDGKGMIYEQDQANLFALVQKKPVRSPYAREILQFVEKEYHTLPFTTRWLSAKFGIGKVNLALRDLLQNGSLHSYAPLIEEASGMVAVHENTLLVTKDGCEWLTKAD
ncbi:MAG TPA: type II methionyl aminopeptidase [Candidatus Binatia bacterium]|nr:type II methionyl aminopeptidase [Candidatus Binatia bacterium]